MAIEIRHFTLTIPANTLPGAPVVQSCKMPVRNVDWIQVVVPPGPSGLVGWAVRVSNTTVIPYDSDPWVITADENITWPTEGFPTSGDWSVAGYNNGTLQHQVFFRFGCSLPSRALATVPVMIDNMVLNAATSAASGNG